MNSTTTGAVCTRKQVSGSGRRLGAKINVCYFAGQPVLPGVYRGIEWPRHKVADFEDWRAKFDEFEPTRKETGATVLREANDPNDVTVINTFESMEAAQAFFVREDLKAAMGEAGVQGPPEILFANEA